RRTFCSPNAAASRAAARAAPDPQSRAALFARARQQIAAAAVFIPFGTPVRWSLAAGDVPGFAPNPAAFHSIPPLARRPD
ncbi:MAG TPA: ABC transporter substrate-binding protein, partial [Novosphingobium sp.]